MQGYYVERRNEHDAVESALASPGALSATAHLASLPGRVTCLDCEA